MTIHQGNLVIRNAADAEKYRSLTEVTGYLSIHADAKLPTLQTVGGSLYIDASAKMAALKTVRGDLYIYAETKLIALKTVGGYLSIDAEAKLDAPKLKSANGQAYPPTEDSNEQPNDGGAALPAMSLRDWFAGQALSLLADPTVLCDPTDTARAVYAIADAMLVERAKGDVK